MSRLPMAETRVKIKLNKNNFKKLISGASIFTTGGGVPYDDQVKSLKKISTFDVDILSLTDFPKNSYICTAAELGPTDVPPLKKDKVIKKMLQLLIKATDKKINGLYAPEIGQESIILESAHYLNLPVADFDPVGFRAVPFIDINIFNLKNLDFSYTPMVASDDRGEIFLLDGPISYERLETILRELTQFSHQGVLFLIGGVLSVDQLIKANLERPSLSSAFGFGQINNHQELISALNPKKLIEGRVFKITDYDEKGFSGKIIKVKSKPGEEYTLIIMNEVIYLLDKDKKIISSVPERILLIDPVRLRGLSGVKVAKNNNLEIAVLDPVKEWQNQKAKKIFGTDRFSFLLKNLA